MRWKALAEIVHTNLPDRLGGPRLARVAVQLVGNATEHHRLVRAPLQNTDAVLLLDERHELVAGLNLS